MNDYTIKGSLNPCTPAGEIQSTTSQVLRTIGIIVGAALAILGALGLTNVINNIIDLDTLSNSLCVGIGGFIIALCLFLRSTRTEDDIIRNGYGGDTYAGKFGRNFDQPGSVNRILRNEG